MRLINADELMEHVWCDRLDSRELIAEMVENMPTIEDTDELEKENEELKIHIAFLNNKISDLKGQIKALVFAVRCDGVSGSEVNYEVG